MAVFQIFGYLCCGFIGVIFIIALVTLSRYMFWIYFRKCEKCGHHMYYTGLRHNKDGEFFYFHCKHCGTWEKISREQYIREIGSNTNTDDYE